MAVSKAIGCALCVETREGDGHDYGAVVRANFSGCGFLSICVCIGSWDYCVGCWSLDSIGRVIALEFVKLVILGYSCLAFWGCFLGFDVLSLLDCIAYI